MTNHEKAANIIAFFAIMFAEDSDAWEAVMELNPNYIIEKFERYVLSMKVEYPWGMHPSLRSHRFHAYVDKWELDLKNEEE
jgi:hypothetical protein